MTTNVLVIEDNPANLELMLYVLRAYGFDAVGCPTGGEGLAKAQSYPFDLILCDIQLPDIDGIEIARRLNLNPRPPLVALTALAMMGDRDRLLASGFDGYISKPIDPQTFAERLKEFLPVEKRPADRVAAAPSGAAVPAQPRQSPPARGQTILIVDDRIENRYLLQTLLRSTGFHVTEAASAKEAVQRAKEARPHMIICDVNMPLYDGEGFLVLLKTDPELAKVPVLMITSSDSPSEHTRERLRKAGAVGLLTRPLESSTLLQVIERELSRSKETGA